MTKRRFKKCLQIYAKYASLRFNPVTGGERMCSNGTEWVILADAGFDPKNLIPWFDE